MASTLRKDNSFGPASHELFCIISKIAFTHPHEQHPHTDRAASDNRDGVFPSNLCAPAKTELNDLAMDQDTLQGDEKAIDDKRR
jgi:hypothetical protein